MNILQKLASSIDDALDLILGEDLPTPADKTLGQYPFLTGYYR